MLLICVKAMVKSLTKFQFQSFPHPPRPDFYESLVEEHEWYSDDSESTLGILFQDRIDGDWAYVVLRIKDEGVFVAVGSEHSIEDMESAREELLIEIDRFSANLLESRTTNETTDVPKTVGGADPFTPIVPSSRMNPLFQLARTLDRFAPARGMIRDVFSTYFDRDGNFLEQFQTTGFDSRIWELYLHAYLVDSGFNFSPSVSPDFVVSKAGTTIGIEAVTANPTQGLDPRQGGQLYSSTRLISSPTDALITELGGAFEYKQRDFVPIKLGSALYSKLKKRYWESDSMGSSVPLVFAIETFHDAASLYYSSAALGTYLYGFRHEHLWRTDGRLLVVPRKVNTHTFGGKTIPSGFFFLPEAENISAVLFSNSGTINKFGRMGQQGAHFDPEIVMLRIGTYYDPDADAAVPQPFRYQVGDPRFDEWWGQGLEMFHNPAALHLVESDYFPGIAHHRLLDNGMVQTDGPSFQPVASATSNINRSGRRDTRQSSAISGRLAQV